MSAYCVPTDISGLYGEPLLIRLSDPDNGVAVDTDLVESAIEDASATIDSNLAVRYSLPLSEEQQTPVLKVFAVDISVYRMAMRATIQTEEMRQRYDDAIRGLERIADRKADLGVPVSEDGDDEEDTDRVGANARIIAMQRG